MDIIISDVSAASHPRIKYEKKALMMKLFQVRNFYFQVLFSVILN